MLYVLLCFKHNFTVSLLAILGENSEKTKNSNFLGKENFLFSFVTSVFKKDSILSNLVFLYLVFPILSTNFFQLLLLFIL